MYFYRDGLIIVAHPVDQGRIPDITETNHWGRRFASVAVVFRSVHLQGLLLKTPIKRTALSPSIKLDHVKIWAYSGRNLSREQVTAHSGAAPLHFPNSLIVSVKHEQRI